MKITILTQMGWVFYKMFFNVDPFFKAFIEFVTKLLLFFMFYFFTVAPQLCIEPILPCIGKHSVSFPGPMMKSSIGLFRRLEIIYIMCLVNSCMYK